MMNKKFDVRNLDIETTGGKYNGITEIAIYKFDGQSVNQFSSLVNPEKPIQPLL